MDIAEAFKGDPDVFVGRYTSWELQQIVCNDTWFVNTLFYLDGILQTPQQLAEMGINAPQANAL